MTGLTVGPYGRGMTRQPGEPDPPSGRTVWFTFTPPTAERIYVTVNGADRTYVTVNGSAPGFGVFTGEAIGKLTPVGDRPSEDCGEQFSFEPVVGTTYRIAVAAPHVTLERFTLRIAPCLPLGTVTTGWSAGG